MTAAENTIDMNNPVAMAQDIAKLKARCAKLEVALFEVVESVASVSKPWDLEGYGIKPKRAEEICELAGSCKAI